MLTYNEKRWLKKRNEWSVCSYCSNIPQTMCLYGERPHFCALLDVDYKDAAEFSERVAAKLAEAFMGVIDAEFNYQLPSNCAACPCEGKCSLDCKDSILKWARLAVEEEMDAEMD